MKEDLTCGLLHPSLLTHALLLTQIAAEHMWCLLSKSGLTYLGDACQCCSCQHVHYTEDAPCMYAHTHTFIQVGGLRTAARSALMRRHQLAALDLTKTSEQHACHITVLLLPCTCRIQLAHSHCIAGTAAYHPPRPPVSVASCWPNARAGSAEAKKMYRDGANTLRAQPRMIAHITD